ncbi:acyl-CoA dehydrogenase family protein [Ruegeria sp.]|uniref:acyl-CoA dehydrogenase family protein n=1 Tax=Ruegeria sp. TaxID=1879320 RepID=UPI003B58D74E
MQKLVKTEDETMLAEAARGFLDAKAPVQHLRAMRDAGRTHDPELWAEMADMGWAGILVPEAQGGVDMGHAAAGVLACEMGKTLAASPFLSTAVIAATALRQAADDRANDALERIAQGALTYGIAVQEGRKFDPETVKMPATGDGNGFRLNGGKTFVVDGALSDRLLVLAQAGQGLTVFDIPADRDGITRTAQAMVDSRDAARVEFDDVVLSGDEVVGAAGQGLDILIPALRAGQAALAAEQLGLATGAVDMTVGYLRERKQFGMLIGSFQALQHRAAKLWCEIEVTSSAVLNAGRMLDANPDAAEVAVSLAKARATDTAVLAVQEGVQMHGGIGMTDEYDMGLYMKRAGVSAEWLGDYGYHAQVIARAKGF